MTNAQMEESRRKHFDVAEQHDSKSRLLLATRQCLQLLRGAPKQAGTELMGFIALAIKYWNCYS
jgi:hypothetical protein